VAETLLVLELRGWFRLEQVEKLIVLLQPLARLDEPRRVRLDLGGLAFISPTCFTVLVAALYEAAAHGRLKQGSTYTKPRSPVVAQYLARMDFHKLMTGNHGAEDFVRRTPHGFHPCERFESPKELGTVAKSLALAATQAARIDDLDRFSAFLAIFEIVKNVTEHAQSPVGGFAMAQHFKRRHEFEVAIVDPGVGIRTSLQRNPQYEDVVTDLEAIRTSLELGVTSRRSAVRGIGLFAIWRLLHENAGTLVVRSGSAVVERGQRESAAEGLAPFGGTIVAIRLKTDRPMRLTTFTELAAPRKIA
jgi:anti-anti-sigma regulatory factor/anti-sigma regulatory factor (Ser/Thr protein kinase)